jgi:plasmid maintenance system killer protein
VACHEAAVICFRKRCNKLFSTVSLARLERLLERFWAPTTAPEVLLRLPALHLKMEAEDQAAIYRLSCNEQWKLRSIRHEQARNVRDMAKDILQMGDDKRYGDIHSLSQRGPTFCDSRANLYNATNMAGRKQNTKILTKVKIKK